MELYGKSLIFVVFILLLLAIIDFSFNKKESPCFQWKPLRTRDRKTENYLKEISYGNDWSIALDNWNSINEVNPDCLNCGYQSFCGVDIVDDISRYSRIDIPKHLTSFCQTHLKKFDYVFEKIMSMEPVNLFNINGHLTKNFNYQPPFGQIFYDTPN